jgi:hypothetical protein
VEFFVRRATLGIGHGSRSACRARRRELASLT